MTLLALDALPTSLRGALVLTPYSILLLAADLVLSLLLPLSAVQPTLVYDVSSQIAWAIWASIQTIFVRINGARIRIAAGSSVLPRHESAIVVANHVSWTDFYMIQALAMRAGMLSRCRWFAKSQLRWVPLLGWGIWAMGFPLVTRDWTHDRGEMERVFGGLRRGRWPVWLIAYSEATRFTPAKHAAAVTWCRENGRPAPRNTLWPRYRGFVATVGQLRQARQVRAVYDMTIAYATREHDRWVWMRAPSFWATVSQANLHSKHRFYVDVQRFELEALPEGDEQLRVWLEQRWVEKDRKLEALRLGLERGMWDGQAVE